MHKILLASAALALFVSPAVAQDSGQANQAAGTLAGTATGAVGGAIIGGPVGAIVGGFIGAAIGNAAAAPEPVVQYVLANPVEAVTVEGEITEGYVVPESVTLAAVPDNAEYGYFYANDGRPIIVNMSDRSIVYAPAVYPEEMVTYIRGNPVDPVVIEGDVTIGSEVRTEVELRPIPDYEGYSYFYFQGRPYVVSNSDRRVLYYLD